MAHPTAPEHSGESITIQKIRARDQRGIAVTLPGATPEGRFEDRHSAYHDNLSPAVEWEDVPGAQYYALIVEDPDAPREKPFVHWMVWDIPGGINQLPEGLPNNSTLVSPQSVIQGRNDRGGYGWFGPLPPRGHGVHRYYFQLFALDAALEMGPDTPLIDLVNALKAHTIADGEAMATYEAPELAS
jgi:Raf kinase inhibitor-like YbhB/YbcL family protein